VEVYDTHSHWFAILASKSIIVSQPLHAFTDCRFVSIDPIWPLTVSESITEGNQYLEHL